MIQLSQLRDYGSAWSWLSDALKLTDSDAVSTLILPSGYIWCII
jgi:hypothetical protein